MLVKDQADDASPPVRGRGLKLFHEAAVRVGGRSPPVRGRGLKRFHAAELRYGRSPPVRGRGLKRTSPRSVRRHDTEGVAPRAGARIETLVATTGMSWAPGSPPVRGRGLKPTIDYRTR